MNDETRDLMRKARCGVPDVVINATSANYVLHGIVYSIYIFIYIYIYVFKYIHI